jgi:hypothetical protein
MRPEQWQRLVQLIDVATFSRLEPVYGCPDCADGGAEWIEIEQGEQRNRVTFEYNATLDPIAALAEEIRQIRSELKPAE